MSASREFCKKQVARLVLAPLFRPATEAAGKEWIDALMDHCQSNEHAAAVMTEFIHAATESDNPIASVVAIARRTEKHETFPPGCSRCTLAPDPETGAPRYASHVSGRTIGGYDCAVRCSCARGEALKARDRQRAAELAKEPRHEGLARLEAQ